MYKKTSTLLAFIAAMATSFAYAGNRQAVTSCVKVQNNHSKFSFQTQFVSTDIFDSWRASPTIYNSESCHSYTYEHGPKSLSVKVNSQQPKVYFELEPACTSYGVYVESLQVIKTKYKHAPLANVNWYFTLTEKSHTPDLSIFTVKCDYHNY